MNNYIIKEKENCNNCGTELRKSDFTGGRGMVIVSESVGKCYCGKCSAMVLMCVNVGGKLLEFVKRM